MNRNDWILMFGLKVVGKAHATLNMTKGRLKPLNLGFQTTFCFNSISNH